MLLRWQRLHDEIAGALLATPSGVALGALFLLLPNTQSFKGWELGLSGLPAEVRRALLDLASAGVGTKIDHLHEGLKRFLRPYLEKTDKGLSFLRDDYQRQLLRVRACVGIWSDMGVHFDLRYNVLSKAVWRCF